MQNPSDSRRRTLRHPARIPARYRTDHLEGRGQVANISRFGLFLIATPLPQPHDSIRVLLEPVDGDPIEISGVVRWTTDQLAPHQQKVRGFGVELAAGESEALARLTPDP